MTFQEAVRKMDLIARGEYHSIQFEIVKYSRSAGGDTSQRCSLYIARGHGRDGFWTKGHENWEDAFREMEAHLADNPAMKPVNEEAPV